MTQNPKNGKEAGRGLIDRIKLDAYQRTPWGKARTSNLFIERRPLVKGDVIQARHQTIPIDRDTVSVFADDAPLLNWSHPCRYLLYDSKSGELYKEVNSGFPPYLVDAPATFNAFHEPVAFAKAEFFQFMDPRHHAVEFGDKLRLFAGGKRYAVLFSGASNNRHTNDLEFLYRTLIDVYDFEPDRIYVLNYDGSINYSGGPKPVGNWPGDGTPYRMPVTAAGTKAELENAFDDLKTRLTGNDFLLVHTNNHGGHNGESYLCTYSGPDYTATDFAAKLGELPRFRKLMVMMEQCHAGGFNGPILAQSPADQTTVASACEEDRSSIGGPSFDPFARDWISAFMGVDPYGAALASSPDTDADSVIAAIEGFNYADAIKHSYDTPVYGETPAGCGLGMHLGRPGPLFVLHRIWKYLKLYEIKEPVPPFPDPELVFPVPRPDPVLVYEDVLERLKQFEDLVHEVKAPTDVTGAAKMVSEQAEYLKRVTGKAAVKPEKLADLREPLNRLLEVFEALEKE